MAKSSDFDSWVFSVSATVFRLCISAFFVLLLTSVFPVVLSANSSCLSQYWCISTDSSNPCTLHSLQSTATGQLCSCVDYQHNFTICLNNVSTSQHFYNFFVSKLIGIITVIENYYHCWHFSDAVERLWYVLEDEWMCLFILRELHFVFLIKRKICNIKQLIW